MAARIVGLLLLGAWFLPALALAQELVVEQGPPADALTVDEIRQKLSTTDIELDLVETPLRDAIDHFEDLLQIPIHLDRWAVVDAGVKLDSPVSLRVNAKALSALRLMLRERNLDYLLEPGRIVITSRDEAATRLQAKFYPAADLITRAPGGGADFRPLAELLTYAIEPLRWEDLGGPGSVAGYDDGIVVTQSDAVHEKVEHLLAVLREVKSLKEGDSLEARPADPQAAARSQLEQKIAQTHVTLALEETPLADFLQMLRAKLEIPVVIDHRGLKDARKKPDLPLSGRWRQMPLETVLNDLFRAEGLSWFASGEVLVVTSYEEVCGETITKVYPVFDLLPREDPAHAALKMPRYGALGPQYGLLEPMTSGPHPYDNLMDLLFTQIVPESWEAYGGSGTMSPYEEAGALVISQSREVHQRIADLLGQIREQSRSAPPNENANTNGEGHAADPSTVTYHAYPPGHTFHVQPEDLPKVVGRMMRVIAPESWQDKAHYVEVLSDRLIVCHRPHVHLAIEEYLSQAMIIPPPVLGFHGYVPVPGGGNSTGQNGASKSGPAARAPNGASDPAAVPQTGGGFF